MQEIITQYDFILLPLYLFVFYLVVRRKSKKYEKLGLRKAFMTAFWLRMAGAVFYGLLIQYYYGYGDTIGYYQGGTVISDMISHDITAVKYLFLPAKDVVAAAKAMGLTDNIPVTMSHDSNALIMKFSAVLSFVTFNKFLLISICFGYFSFVGIWKLFYVFYRLNNMRHVRLLTFFVLYLPSLWFWGSGLIKEPLCIGALGILADSSYSAFKNKASYTLNIILILLMTAILLIVKAYIVGILLVSLFIVAFVYLIGQIRSRLVRFPVIIFCFVTAYIIIDNSNIDAAIEQFVDNAFKQIEVFQNSYQAVQVEDERSKATFMLSEINPTLEGMILNAPVVIGSCLFRPFPWEAKKVIMFLSSMEAVLTLLVTLYVLVRLYFFKFFMYVFGDPVSLFCFIFSMLLAILIGYTTFNFGTMVRYKIIFLPFYFFMLIHVYTRFKRAAEAAV